MDDLQAMQLEESRKQFEEDMEQRRREFETGLDERAQKREGRTNGVFIFLALAGIALAVVEVVGAFFGGTDVTVVLP